jgi:hypothetical protein
VAQPERQLVGRTERLLQRHLLIQHHGEQQRQRVA